MEKLLKCALMIVLAFPSLLKAQSLDFLRPVESVYGWTASSIEYDYLVATVLQPALPDGVPKVVVRPSFMPEYVIGVDDSRQGCNIVKATSVESSWGRYRSTEFADLVQELQDVSKNFPLEIERRSIERSICSRISAVWTYMVMRTRYPTPEEIDSVTLDGVGYEFSTFVRSVGYIAGAAVNPDRKTLPGRLASVADAMASYAEGEDPASLERLVNALEVVESPMLLESAIRISID